MPDAPSTATRADEALALRMMLDDALALLEVGDEANTPGTDTYTFLASTRATLDRMDAGAFERALGGLAGIATRVPAEAVEADHVG